MSQKTVIEATEDLVKAVNAVCDLALKGGGLAAMDAVMTIRQAFANSMVVDIASAAHPEIIPPGQQFRS